MLYSGETKDRMQLLNWSNYTLYQTVGGGFSKWRLIKNDWLVMMQFSQNAASSVNFTYIKNAGPLRGPRKWVREMAIPSYPVSRAIAGPSCLRGYKFGPPGWGLGMGLTTHPGKNWMLRNQSNACRTECRRRGTVKAIKVWNGLWYHSKSKVKQSRYTPWRRLGVRGGIASTHSRPRH
jgi:hypothetical protein